MAEIIRANLSIHWRLLDFPENVNVQQFFFCWRFSQFHQIIVTIIFIWIIWLEKSESVNFSLDFCSNLWAEKRLCVFVVYLYQKKRWIYFFVLFAGKCCWRLFHLPEYFYLSCGALLLLKARCVVFSLIYIFFSSYIYMFLHL